MNSYYPRVILLALALCVPSFLSRSQEADADWISGDYEFVLHLLDNNLKRDAATLVLDGGYMPSDTLCFLRAWTLYQLKELEAASAAFSAVPQGSVFSEQAFFYSNAVDAHLGNYNSPVSRLEAYEGPYRELKDVQLAGLALLRDDKEGYLRSAAAFSRRDPALAQAESELSDIFSSRFEKKGKSPWVAAAASALVPGLGKLYAGQPGEGVSAFLLTGAFAAVTAEHWVKDGAGDWKTIVPGLLCAVLYIGNIYGSYMSVSIYNTRLHEAQNTAVLYSIHIPLRSVFR